MEALCTAVLAITVFSTVDKTRHDHHGSGPLAIGIAVGLSHFFAVCCYFSELNPGTLETSIGNYLYNFIFYLLNLMHTFMEM